MPHGNGSIVFNRGVSRTVLIVSAVNINDSMVAQ